MQNYRVNLNLLFPVTLSDNRFAKSLIALSAAFFALMLIVSQAIAAPAPSRPSSQKPMASEETQASFALNEQGIAALQREDLKNAEMSFRSALAKDPGNVTAAFNLAGLLVNNKQLKDAIEILSRYAAENPTDAGLLSRLGDAYFADKQVDQALSAYNKALSANPDYPRIYSKLATIYGLMNQPLKAEEMLLQAVEKDPKDGQSLASLSAVFLLNGKADKAVSTAKRALQVSPSSEIYITLGSAYEAQGDLKNSVIAFQRAKDLGDTRAELQDKINQLKTRSEAQAKTS